MTDKPKTMLEEHKERWAREVEGHSTTPRTEYKRTVRKAPLALAERPRCLACDKPLPLAPEAYSKHGETWGEYGDGFFCGLRCGRVFGVLAARAGYRRKT